ncbi:MAG: hypothetical protein QF860_11920 [Planctomycetota bacterium]|nr:hypothetical protein [Planctomycetota bacterium]
MRKVAPPDAGVRRGGAFALATRVATAGILALALALLLQGSLGRADDRPGPTSGGSDTGAASSEDPTSTQADSLIRSGLAALWRTEFGTARAAFSARTALDPADPEGYFFEAMLHWLRLTEGFEVDPSDAERFEASMRLTLEAARPHDRRGDPMRARALFHMGGAYGYRARLAALRGSWFAAYRDAVKGRRLLEHARRLDPGLRDVELGLGLYHYYADILPGIVGVLGRLVGLGGDREKGLAELRRARREGRYTRDQAAFVLTVLYNEFEERPWQALALSRDLRSRHPEAYGFAIQEAQALGAVGEVDAGLAVLAAAREHLPEGDRRASMDYWTGRQLVQAGRLASARVALERALAGFGGRDHWVAAWTRFWLGYCDELAGRPRDAEAHYLATEAFARNRGPRAFAERRRKNPLGPVERERVLVRAALMDREGESLRERLGALQALAAEELSLEAAERAELAWLRARLRQRVGLECDSLYAAAGRAEGVPSEIAALVPIRRARLRYEAADLGEAQRLLKDALAGPDEEGSRELARRALAVLERRRAAAGVGTAPADGAARFSLWRPDAWSVDVAFDTLAALHPLRLGEDGVWRGRVLPPRGARAYRFVVDGMRPGIIDPLVGEVCELGVGPDGGAAFGSRLRPPASGDGAGGRGALVETGRADRADRDEAGPVVAE